MKSLFCIILVFVAGCHSGAIYFKPKPKPPTSNTQVAPNQVAPNDEPPTTVKHVSCVGDLAKEDSNFVSQPYDYKATFNTDGSTSVSIWMSCDCGDKEASANYLSNDPNARDGYISTMIGKYVLEKYEFTMDLNSLTLNVLFDNKYNLEITDVCVVE